jgi:hypothetical protein
MRSRNINIRTRFPQVLVHENVLSNGWKRVPKFGYLPVEVQMMIWKDAALIPRVVHIRPNATGLCEHGYICFWFCGHPTHMVSDNIAPGVLMACKNSRIEGLKIYSPLNVVCRVCGLKIYVNLQQDTIHFRMPDDDRRLMPSYVINGLEAAELAAIQHMVLDCNPDFDVGNAMCQNLLDHETLILPPVFTDLKTLSFLEEDERDLPSNGCAEIVESGRRPTSHPSTPHSGRFGSYSFALDINAGLIDEDRKMNILQPRFWTT